MSSSSPLIWENSFSSRASSRTNSKVQLLRGKFLRIRLLDCNEQQGGWCRTNKRFKLLVLGCLTSGTKLCSLSGKEIEHIYPLLDPVLRTWHLCLAQQCLRYRQNGVWPQVKSKSNTDKCSQTSKSSIPLERYRVLTCKRTISHQVNFQTTRWQTQGLLKISMQLKLISYLKISEILSTRSRRGRDRPMKLSDDSSRE